MLIKYLKLKNFRQFYGTHELYFSTDELNKVTTVIGDNTTGKTTLLQSFSWCLYGELELPEKKNILNLDKKNELSNDEKADVFVEIELTHNKKVYTIKREQKCSKKGYSQTGTNLSVQCMDDKGNTNNVQNLNCQNVVNEILPNGLSHCFFFDNERINNITKKGQIAKSVELLLGLESIGNAEDHLGDMTRKTSVIGKLGSELKSVNQKELLLKQDELDKKAEQLDNSKDKIKQHEVNITKLEALFNENSNILRDNEQTTKIKSKIDSLANSIVDVNKNIKINEKNFLKYVSNNFEVLFGHQIYDNIIKQLSGNDDQTHSDIYIPTGVIEEIIKTRKCICGNRVYEESTEYKALLALLENSKQNKVKNTKDSYVTKISTLNSSFNQIFEEQNNLHIEIEKSRSQINDLEFDREAKQKEISDKKDFKDLISDNEKIIQQIKKDQEKKENAMLDTQSLTATINDLSTEIIKMTQENIENRKVFAWIEYAEGLKKYFSNLLNREKENIRNSLQINVNEIFAKMYSGKRKIKIDEKYEISLYYTNNSDGVVSTESPGLTTVKNFAYITGLVKTAHERMVHENKEDDIINIETEPFPLIMDAPFSNIDEHHIRQISKVLPEVAEQIIFFTMKKDWDIAEKTMPHVGKCYTLHKLSETKTEIRGGK